MPRSIGFQRFIRFPYMKATKPIDPKTNPPIKLAVLKFNIAV